MKIKLKKYTSYIHKYKLNQKVFYFSLNHFSYHQSRIVEAVTIFDGNELKYTISNDKPNVITFLHNFDPCNYIDSKKLNIFYIVRTIEGYLVFDKEEKYTDKPL